MNKNLLIIGAGVYGLVAKEVAESMGCFQKIAFADDHAKTTPNGIEVIGTVADMEDLVCDYYNVFVAIGNPYVRLRLLKMLEELPCRIVTLVSPHAYVAPSAQLGKGCIVEPMAVIHTGCVVMCGCIVSAGAVVNHCSILCDGAHVDCNATVAGNTMVPAGTKVCSWGVFRHDQIRTEDLFLDSDKQAEKIQTSSARIPQGGPVETDQQKYSFEDGM